MPDLGQLRRLAIFATVVDQGSFAKAATVLGMSRPAVSEQVRILEENLAVRLLQRSTRRLSLTWEGEQVYPQASVLLGTLGNIAELTAHEKPTGRIRIATIADIAERWLIPKLVPFQAANPAITFDFVLSDSVSDLVAEGIDLAIRGTSATPDSSLIARPLFEDSVIPLAAPRFLNQITTKIIPETALDFPWILLAQSSPGGRVHLTKDGKVMGGVPILSHRSTSPQVCRQMIRSGFGIGFEIPRLVANDIRDGRLVPVLPGWKGPSFRFSLLYPTKRHLPLRVRMLIDHLISALSEEQEFLANL